MDANIHMIDNYGLLYAVTTSMEHDAHITDTGTQEV